MSLFTIWNVQSAVTCESGRVPPRKSFYFSISKLILYFLYCFHVPCAVLFSVLSCIPSTVLFTVYLHIVVSMFRFLCYWSHSKANAVDQTIQLDFIKDLPSITQSNLQAATAENEEQYTLSNIIYIKLQNCCFFFEVYFEGNTPKM